MSGDRNHEQRARELLTKAVDPSTSIYSSFVSCDDAIRAITAALSQQSCLTWPAGELNRDKTLEVLTQHNRWRRGAEGPQTDPRTLGLALDAAIAYIAAAQQPAINLNPDPLNQVATQPPYEAEQAPPAARPLSEWHEDDGDVVWWRFDVEEPAWIGTPNDFDWPGYHTHWTPHPAIPVPAAQPSQEADHA